MEKEFPPSNLDIDRFGRKKKELIHRLSIRDPHQLARDTGSVFDAFENSKGTFSLKFWGSRVLISFPDFTAQDSESGKELIEIDRVMLLYYFDTCNGASNTGVWISFSELPDGQFYNQAFQGYTGRTLTQNFGGDIETFKLSALKLSGKRFPLGSSAFIFQVLPRVHLLVVCWLGDEDFPTSFQILFDSSASRFLPTDAYAILGSTLTRKLIKVKTY